MKITLANQEFFYETKKELKDILSKFPNIKFLGNYSIGDDFTAGDGFTAGDRFTAGYGFTAGDRFTAGDGFTAGDDFTAGYGFTAGDDFTAGDKFEITNHIIFPNHYRYIARCYYELNSKQWYIQLGCYMKTLQEWESNFWNNDSEFPNDNSEKSNARLNLYNLIKHNIEFLNQNKSL